MSRFKTLINELQEIIYVSDPRTYELYFLNKVGCKDLGVGDYEGQKCYKVLQGLDAPCDMCTSGKLNVSDFYVWEYTNPRNGRHYILKDKFILWENNRLARLEVAVDITEKENTSKYVREKLELERALVDCIRTLTLPVSFDGAVNGVLQKIGAFHKADRAYIFELDREKRVIRNTHEWCAPGVIPQKDNLAELPADKVTNWLEVFKNKRPIVINDIESIKKIYPSEYEVLKPQQISALMVAPLFHDGMIVGFTGIDNPHNMVSEVSLLSSLAYFLQMEMQKRKAEDRLEYMSYHDALTGVNNRNKYIRLIEEFNPSEVGSLGVAFVDINSLKAINDRFGHSCGDAVISGTCNIIKKYVRSEDIYRIGGDEFVMICADISRELFREKIKKMKNEIDSAHRWSVSVGWIWSDKDLDLKSMTEQADNFMYRNKEQYYMNKSAPEKQRDTRTADNNPSVFPLSEEETYENACEKPYEALALNVFDYIATVDPSLGKIIRIHTSGNMPFSILDKNDLDLTVDNFIDNMLHPNDKKKVLRHWEEVFGNGEKPLHKELEFRVVGKDKKYYWLSACLVTCPDTGNIFIGVKNISPIIDNYGGYFDPLTGLLSPHTFYQETRYLLDKNKRSEYVFIVMDIDKFKVINDIYGPEAGNQALVNISAAIRTNLGADEICSRIYADTFFILARRNSEEEAVELTRDITRELNFSDFGNHLKPRYGILTIKDPSLSVIALGDMASYAHKSAKESGGKNYVFYTDEIKRETVEIKELESEMEEALKDFQFRMYLQPKYDIVAGKVVGAEALVRWMHPRKGIISPDKFIPLFEYNGFITKLDQHMRENVCIFLKQRLDAGLETLPVSVNVSLSNLRNKNLAEEIVDMIDSYGLPRELLQLEFTESVCTDNLEEFSDLVKNLQRNGIVVEMDDFGSGYSSLNMLKDISVDVIKLDCKFFEGQTITDREKTIIKYTVEMAKELNMSVIAEGVETEEQVEFLKSTGCRVVQGYYFYKPLPAEKFENILNFPPEHAGGGD